MKPTLRLTEYRPREVRLPFADVAFLLANHSADIEVQPLLRRGLYRLTALGKVGVLELPNARIVIRPKIPLANLFALLELPSEVFESETRPECDPDAVDLLAWYFSQLLQKRALRGLPRAYLEEAQQQPFFQGRLDIAAQVRDVNLARDHFHVVREEFTADTVVHRLAKATAVALLAAKILTLEVVQPLRRALQAYDEITLLPLSEIRWPIRPTAEDQPLLDMCRLLLEGLHPGEKSGATHGPTFLLDMEQIFERYLYRLLQTAYSNVAYQQEFSFHEPLISQQPPLIGRPDFVVNGRLIIDAKWKQLTNAVPARDVQQILAYASGLGLKDVQLTYPGRRNLAWRYELPASGIRLTIQQLRVVGTREKCKRAAARWLKSLQAT